MKKQDREASSYSHITFGEIRKFCSVIDRVSICMMEDLSYENFERIRDVPHSYDDKYLYGFGGIESEFTEGEKRMLRPCMEIMLSKMPRKEAEDI